MKKNIVLIDNENETNRIISNIFPFFIIPLLLFEMLNQLNVFGNKYQNISLTIPFIIVSIILCLPLILRKLRIEGWYVKYINITISIILAGVLYYILTGDAIILFPVPIVLSTLYFNKQLTIYSYIVSTTLFAALNAFRSQNPQTDPWSTKVITISVFMFIAYWLVMKCIRLLNNLVGAEEQAELYNRVSRLLENSQNVSKQVNEAVSNLFRIAQDAKVFNEKISESTDQVVVTSKVSLDNSNNVTNGIINVMEQFKIIDRFSKDMYETYLKINELIKDSNVKITNAVEHIEFLSQINNDSITALGKLNEEFSNINVIIETINSISSQTKLLSLNASIEAARSGEYGQGFNVVAQEIGKLAEQTNTSTKNITRLINNIKDNSRNTDQIMAKGYVTIKDSIDEISSLSNGFREIVDIEAVMNKKINDISQKISEISSNSDFTIRDASKIYDSTKSVIQSIEDIDSFTKSQLDLNNQIFELVKEISKTTNKLVEQE